MQAAKARRTAAVPVVITTGTAAVTLLGVALVGVPVAAPVIIGLVAAFWWVWLCGKNPVVAVVVVVGIVVFSSHVFAFSFSQLGVPAAIVANLIAVKDVAAMALLLVLVVRAVATGERSAAILPLIALVGLAIIFLAFVNSPAPLATQVQALRGAVVGVLALGIGALLNNGELRRVARGIVSVVTVAAILALIQLALPVSFVSDVIGVGPYWAQVKGGSIFLNALTGLPWNFFTTSGFPRLSGTFGDPLAAGMILGVTLLLAIAYRTAIKLPVATITVLSVALLLTFTRNGWILALIGFIFLSAVQRGLARTVLVSALIAAVLSAAASVIPPLQEYVFGILTGTDASTIAHQAEFEAALDHSFPPIGRGWGTGGAAASDAFAEAVSNESAYVALLAQLGWLGFGLYLILVIMLAWLSIRGRTSLIIGAAILLGLAVTAAVSENILTFNAGWIPFLSAPTLAAAPRRDELERRKEVRSTAATRSRAPFRLDRRVRAAMGDRVRLRRAEDPPARPAHRAAVEIPRSGPPGDLGTPVLPLRDPRTHG